MSILSAIAQQVFPSHAFSAVGRSLSGRRRKSIGRCSESVHPLLQQLDSELCCALQDLESELELQMRASGEGDHSSMGLLTAEWLNRALQLVLQTFSNACHVFPFLKGNGEHLVDDIVEVVDVCDFLRQTIVDMKRYHASLHVALRCLRGTGTGAQAHCLRARHALSDCLRGIYDADEQRQRTTKKCMRRLQSMASSTSTSEALYGVKAITVLVCQLVLFAFHPTEPRKRKASFAALRGAHHHVCSPSLAALLHHLKPPPHASSPLLLQEAHNLHSSLQNLYTLFHSNHVKFPLTPHTLNHINHSTYILGRCVEDLGICIGAFEQNMDNLFNLLLSARVALLDITSH